MKLNENIFEALKLRPGQHFTAREIAEWICETYPESCKEKQERIKATISPIEDQSAVIRQIASEISAKTQWIQENFQGIKTTAERPRKYYYTELSDLNEILSSNDPQGSSTKSQEPKLSEHDLYPMLTTFLWAENKLYSKRIDEKRSSNKRGSGGNKWLYPDVVAMEDLGLDWHNQTKLCVEQYADRRTRLWSFEVKIKLNRSNIRESFFQAVSNSSWANFGYLVAAELNDNAMNELRILSSLHGIGFILLNQKIPADSQIMIPAREKGLVDWATANRITEENTDFQEYLEEIKRFYQTGSTRLSDWDNPDIENYDDISSSTIFS